jgi:Tfp pilus assembly protein FimT
MDSTAFGQKWNIRSGIAFVTAITFLFGKKCGFCVLGHVTFLKMGDKYSVGTNSIALERNAVALMKRIGSGRKFSAAFSLIELCLVLAGMTVIGAFAVPMFSSVMHSMQLNAESRKIATGLMNARLCASSHASPFRIAFLCASNSWQLERFDPDESKFVAYEAENGVSEGLSNSGISLRAGVATQITGFPKTSSEYITFNARGFPIDSSGAPTAANVIYIADSDTELGITVSLTGKIQVLKNEEGVWTSCH